MGVDKARRDQRVGVFGDGGVGGQRRQQFTGVADSADLTVLNHQQAVFEVFVGRFYAHFGRVGDAVQNGGAVSFAGHDVSQVVAWLRLDDGSKCVMGSARAVCWPKWAL